MTEPRRRTTTALASIAAIVATLIAGCGQDASSTTAQTAPSGQTSNVTTTTHRPPTPAHKHGQHAAGASQRKRTALAYSTASAHAVQPQPRPGSCHSIGTGLSARPDPRCTPGALNPAVTQASIRATICVPGWTASVRPPESVTEPEKRASIDAYGDAGPISSYEYDHFVPLELGGAVNDPRNLWPEPGASPNPKDTVENELKQKVCHGQITLTDAQRAITTNWTTVAAAASAPSRSSTSTTPRPQSSPPPGSRALLRQRLLQQCSPRLRRQRELEPARTNCHRDGRRGPLGRLAHEQRRVRRRLLPRRRRRRRPDDNRPRRQRHLPSHPVAGLGLVT
jgi:hypothetical protein